MKHMLRVDVRRPDGSTQVIFLPRGVSDARAKKIMYNLRCQWRSERASDVSPYTQGVCAICSIGTGLKRCDGCGIVQYCSKDHQHDHWKGSHRHECRDLYARMMVPVADTISRERFLSGLAGGSLD